MESHTSCAEQTKRKWRERNWGRGQECFHVTLGKESGELATGNGSQRKTKSSISSASSDTLSFSNTVFSRAKSKDRRKHVIRPECTFMLQGDDWCNHERLWNQVSKFCHASILKTNYLTEQANFHTPRGERDLENNLFFYLQTVSGLDLPLDQVVHT